MTARPIEQTNKEQSSIQELKMEKSASGDHVGARTRSRSKNLMPPESVAEGIEQFTNDLFKCAAKDNEGNFVISGLSAHLALSLCALGAKGDTADQMHKVLRYPQSNSYDNYKELVEYLNNSNYVTIGIVNKICADSSIDIKESFKKNLSSLFHTKVEQMNFRNNAEEVVRSMNNFCAKATENKIEKIISIDDIKEDTKLLIANAIYFKADWQEPFGSMCTIPRPFHINKKVVLDVPTMTTNQYFGYKDLEDLNAQCVALPYEDSDFIFIVICPKELNGLKSLEANIENFNWNYKDLFNNKRDILLFLPKFKITNEVTIKDYLKNLGMVQAFSTTADFNGISEKPTLIPPLHIDNVIQKVIIEVNEKGTEAVAFTRVRMRGGGGPCTPPPPPYEFKIDRPFLYRIVNVSNNITLFSGRIVKPEYS